MAADNALWGAERIRGELGKLVIHVAKRTIQTYPCGRGTPRPRGQTWAAFVRQHATAIWACDFLPVTDLAFRPLFAFFIIELATRQVVHVGATRHPTDAWVAQQCEADRRVSSQDTGPLCRHRSEILDTLLEVAALLGEEGVGLLGGEHPDAARQRQLLEGGGGAPLGQGEVAGEVAREHIGVA